MRRYKASLLIVISLMGLGLMFAQPSPSAAVEVANLREQLENGLKARLPNEFKFIDTVVTMVEDNSMPRELVDSTFLWVRKKKSKVAAPFPYFERALRLRAEKLGIVIP